MTTFFHTKMIYTSLYVQQSSVKSIIKKWRKNFLKLAWIWLCPWQETWPDWRWRPPFSKCWWGSSLQGQLGEGAICLMRQNYGHQHLSENSSLGEDLFSSKTTTPQARSKCYKKQVVQNQVQCFGSGKSKPSCQPKSCSCPIPRATWQEHELLCEKRRSKKIVWSDLS